jgi:hypothetical protein
MVRVGVLEKFNKFYHSSKIVDIHISDLSEIHPDLSYHVRGYHNPFDFEQMDFFIANTALFRTRYKQIDRLRNLDYFSILENTSEKRIFQTISISWTP